ncbi:hybrid sensor histidine kinase/response regulator transcription factor [Aliikangiella sp. IMCC44359]|uniref:hybrid sensor histidine kinase/response regulator transcription factor n=1 Tax=Aliikangiella sp. IMCC44359 TaxID=3459125 RepID=UPI00403AE12D
MQSYNITIKNFSYFILFLFIVYLPNSISAANYVTYGTESGLSKPAINAIVKDKQGFIWVGTQDGLNRFDGYQFKVFRNDSANSSSISHNYISKLLIDSNHQLWVATSTGLDKYDPETQQFIHFESGLFNRNFFESLFIWALQEGNNNELILITTKGIIIFDTLSETFSFIQDNVGNSSPNAEEQNNFFKQTEFNDTALISSIKQPNRKYLFATNKGLYKYSAPSSQLELISSASVSPTAKEPRLYCISNQLSKIRFFCSREGIYYLHDNKTFFISNKSLKLPTAAIDLYFSEKHELWIGTSEGLFIKKLDINQLSQTLLEPNLIQISSDKIISIFQDRDGVFWIGSNGAGLFKLSPNSQVFNHLRGASQLNSFANVNKNYLTNNAAASLSVSIDNIYVGDSKGAINIINTKTKQIKKINLVNSTKEPVKTTILDILPISNKHIWVASRAGLTQIDLNKNKQKTFEILDSRFAQNNYPTQIFKINEQFFVTGLLSGLTQFDPETESFTPITPKNKKEIFAPFIATAIVKNDTIWMSGYQGILYQFKIKENLGYSYPVKDSKNPIYSLSQVYNMNFDSSKNLWLAGMGGLAKFNIEQQTVEYLNTIYSLPQRAHLSVIEDKQGFIWTTTAANLLRINPQNNQLYTYSKDSGMPITGFTSQVIQDKSNQLFFGGMNGLLQFSPEKINSPLKKLPITLTDTEIKHNTHSNDSSITWKHFQKQKNNKIILDRSNNSIKLSFAILNFAHNSDLHYRYKLTNYDSGWNLNENKKPHAVYTKLPYGYYLLEASFSLDGRHWQKSQIIANIEVMPAWWETILAKTLYVLAVLITLIFIYFWKVNQLKKKANDLTIAIDEKTKDIRELLEQKTQFFSYISHELKTPLSLVQDPLERLAKVPEERKIELVNIARRNIVKVSEMVDRLLNSTSIETTKPRHTVFIQPRIENAITQLSEFASQHSVQFVIRRLDDCSVLATEDEIDIILFNLLSNAIKYNKENGHIFISCIYFNHRCILRVSDDGIGITDINQTFDLTNRRKNKNGYGLKLVNQVTVGLNGNLKVKSKKNYGTIVNISLSGTHTKNDLCQELITTNKNNYSEATPLNSQLSKNKALIFIVEDSTALRNYLFDLFREAYQCVAFSNAEDALGRSLQLIPDIIITDIELPGMSGTELSHQIRTSQETSHIPILLLTGKKYNSKEILDSLNYAIDCITKPFSSEALLIKVTNLLQIIQQIGSKNQKVSLTNLYTEEKSKSLGLTQKDTIFMQRLIDTLAVNYKDSKYNLSSLSNDMFMSKTQLSRKLQAISNKTPIEYLKEYRLERAIPLLSEGTTLSEVSYACGFSSQSYFSTCFKSYFGKTPKQFQLSIINDKRKKPI